MLYNSEKIITMSDEEFRAIRDYINKQCGLYFELPSKYLLEKRLSKRVQAHRLSSFREYHLYLLYDKNSAEELNQITDILTTNETYFYREAYQLKAFQEEILPELIATKKEKVLRIWSAGCSTGEEPYTIAMLVIETGLFDGWQVEIVGSDISQRVLHTARRGIYSDPSFRVIPEEYRNRFFYRNEDGKHGVNDQVKDLVTFGKINLLDSNRINLIPRVDVVFCRNVIIYFDIETKKKVISNFYNRLETSGYLLLGHSESLMNISTSFKLKHLKNDMVYQKPETDEDLYPDLLARKGL